MALMTAAELAEYRADYRAECSTLLIVLSYNDKTDNAGGNVRVQADNTTPGYYEAFRTLGNIAPIIGQGTVKVNPASKVEHITGYDVSLPLDSVGALMSLTSGVLVSAGKVIGETDRLQFPDGKIMNIVSIDNEVTDALALMVHCKQRK